MLIAALIFSARDWIIPAGAFVAVIFLLGLWSYSRGFVNTRVRIVALLLKILGVAALAFCLLEPLWSGNRARPGANAFALLADNSQGMQIRDHAKAQSRGEILRQTLVAEKAGWMERLGEVFQVRRFFFDSRLHSSRDFSDLDFDGHASAIGTALKSLAARYQGQPLAGILLFSDGNATDIRGDSMDFTGLPPVYPVISGEDEAIQDTGFNNVSVTQTAFEDAPVTIQADVTSFGYSGSTLAVDLLSLDQPSTNAVTNAVAAPAKIVAHQTMKAGKDGEPVSFRFQLRPEKPGLSFYKLQLSPEGFKPANPGDRVEEATLANNSRVVMVDRGQGPYRLLYVTGRPNWEYKFMRRALEEDDQMHLVGLIRVAKREGKFTFRGRTGESSNPLFRGFDKTTEETERYDQPVLIRLNISDTDPNELRSGFPKTAEELYQYQAVILDDIESEFFTHDQLVLLRQFVAERGGGFLMLGGPDSFQDGRYEKTPLKDVLPIYLDQATDKPANEPLRFSLTQEGWLQPWARLRRTEVEERTRLDKMTSFRIMNRVRDVKPGASVIGRVTDGKGEARPGLVVQRFGNGRSGALLIGDLWRGALRDETQHEDLNKTWRQIMRWLVADVPKRLDLQAQPKLNDPDQAIELRARIRDKKFQPLDNAAVSLKVQPISPAETGPTNKALPKAVVSLTAEASASEAGDYEATYIPRQTGGYRAEAIVSDPSGIEIGRAETGWTSDPAADEFRSINPNRALMETIARKTGGEVISMAKLADFASSLEHRKAPIVETWTFPVWHRAAVILFAIVCLVFEWGLRRWKGLA